MGEPVAEAGLRQVVDGVFAWVQPDGTWWVNNAGAVAGDGAVLVVDTCATEQRTRRFLGALDEATGGVPVRMAVNTHQHGDHAYGNSLLPEAAVLFGHEAMRAALLADFVIDGCPPFWTPVPDWGNVTRRVPDVAIRGEVTVFAGGRRVELRHPGYAAHTPGDVVAWLPEERVLFTGDLIFNGLTPLVMMGSVRGALESLEWLAAFGAEHVVPGHGPLADAASLPGILAAHERYYRLVLDVARKGREHGLTPLAAARGADLGEFAAWDDAERLVLNLHRAYADAEGGEVDLLTAFGDAMTYHGGPLPTRV
ncbi:MBL fold metallo-hydrolase [Nonomuraea sp. C10]|uniref:MBL fold metallo-hydrolase n=1 Tax=Nonomuraea sp. C10 TaxID=2600577 RepID=UPI0011CDD49A|nr:MBL fold metallo-hydrolase [Nonomuraea sp. C10]TXK39173.1 MBL fold metallo-hydrolase [Nonomuraea sp. C10]